MSTSLDFNTETKSKIAGLAGVFCAIGAGCLGFTAGNGIVDAMIWAIIGLVVGFTSAFIRPGLAFLLILISAGGFWYGVKQFKMPLSAKERADEEKEAVAELVADKARRKAEAEAETQLSTTVSTNSHVSPAQPVQ